MDVALAIVIGVVAVYVGSALLHPYVACETCGGHGRHAGALFKKAMRPCHKCSGTGQKQRFTAALLGIGRERKSSSKVQPSTASFKKKKPD